MPVATSTKLALVAIALCASVACIPISSGAEGDPCGPELPCRTGLACEDEVCVPYVSDPGNGHNTEPYLLPSLDSVCRDDRLEPYLATGADLLAVTRPEYLTTLASDPPTALTLGVSYQGGRIQCSPAQLAPPDSGMPDQPAFVTVEVMIDFVTADGDFDEHFTSPLSGVYKTANFVVAMSLAELGGDFDPQLPEHESLGVTIGGTFAADETWGELRKTGQRPGDAPESLPVGIWDNRE
jgi:hypothetical protein